MPWYQLNVRHHTQLSRAQAWQFLGNIDNLEAMTPKHMRFKLLSQRSTELAMGSILAYSIQPLPFIRMVWISEISAFEPMKRFCDTQLSGPYKSWIHEHRIEGNDTGPCTLVDEIHFQLPFGLLGRFAYFLYIKSALNKAFAYRREALNRLINNPHSHNYEITLQRIKA